MEILGLLKTLAILLKPESLTRVLMVADHPGFFWRELEEERQYCQKMGLSGWFQWQQETYEAADAEPKEGIEDQRRDDFNKFTDALEMSPCSYGKTLLLDLDQDGFKKHLDYFHCLFCNRFMSVLPWQPFHDLLSAILEDIDAEFNLEISFGTSNFKRAWESIMEGSSDVSQAELESETIKFFCNYIAHQDTGPTLKLNAISP